MDHNITFTFDTGLRGYHEYKRVWNPYIHQFLDFRQERDNYHDDFAVAGYARLPGRLRMSVVGHIPRELSRHIWFALDLGARVTGEVKSERYRPFPLLQGGLEIPITVIVEWENEKALEILKERVKKVGPMNEQYKDDSKEILKEILGDDYGENDEGIDDDDFEAEIEDDVFGQDSGKGASINDDEEDDEMSETEEYSGNNRNRKAPRILISSDDDDDDQ